MTDKNPGKSTNAQEAKKKREVAQAVSTYLESGTILLNKYQIERRIASGGFGQIYRVKFQKAENITLAAKVSRREVAHFRRMILEQMILTKLRGKKHVPMIIASGNYKEFMFIIMRMLGPDLARIRRKTEQKRFSVPTVLQFGIQAIEALKDVHDRGYLHRDVKPRNFCIGAENDRHRFYLIDYGMTRRFICEKSGVPRAPRRCAGFRGTARYVSVTVHDRKEQGPVDDFWSLLYVLIDLAEGSLPWRQQHEEATGNMKREIIIENLFIHLPKELKRFSDHLKSLTIFAVKPKYKLLREILEKCFPEGINVEAPLDWEVNPTVLE